MSKYLNLTNQAYLFIRDAIVYGDLDFGEPLSEQELAKALGMSKSPVRAAIAELRLKGLVNVIPKSGSYVFSPTSDDIKELCDFRFILENVAMTKAMEADPIGLLNKLNNIVKRMELALSKNEIITGKRCDDEFHKAFISFSHNHYIKDAYDSIIHKVEALRYRFMDNPEYRSKGFAEHRQIICLLEKKKIEAAYKLLSKHISRTKMTQSQVFWGSENLNRGNYKHRDYASIFNKKK
jgi:DNA-binding GntR family transcriptional regulator